jgi:hypothetical protein
MPMLPADYVEALAKHVDSLPRTSESIGGQLAAALEGHQGGSAFRSKRISARPPSELASGGIALSCSATLFRNSDRSADEINEVRLPCLNQ